MRNVMSQNEISNPAQAGTVTPITHEALSADYTGVPYLSLGMVGEILDLLEDVEPLRMVRGV